VALAGSFILAGISLTVNRRGYDSNKSIEPTTIHLSGQHKGFAAI
jgi:hypothetical protein